jgi:hypothetical protein
MACLIANVSRLKRIENEARAKKKSLPVDSTHHNPKDAEEDDDDYDDYDYDDDYGLYQEDSGEDGMPSGDDSGRYIDSHDGISLYCY